MRTARMLGTWLLLGMVAALAAADELPFPDDEPQTSAQAAEFLQCGEAWLDANPDDPQAPRLLQDMLMAAGVYRIEPHVKTAKVRLLLIYPDSLPARYLLQSSKADEIRGVLKDRFNDPGRPIDRPILSRFKTTIERCVAIYGPSFLDDDLRVIAALSASQPHIAARLNREITDRQGNAGRTLKVALDERLSARERLLELQPLHHYATALAYQSYLYREELDEEERGDFDVRALVVENRLHAGSLTEALPMLTQLCAERREPRLLAWLGWAQGACGQFAQAEETFQGLKHEFPESEWTGAAEALREAFAVFDREIDGQATVLNRAVRELKRAIPDVIELTVAWNSGSRSVREFYVLLDLPHDSLEFSCDAGGKMLLAAQSGPKGTGFYVDGERAIHRFDGAGTTPQCQFACGPIGADAIDWNFRFEMVRQGAGALLQSYQNLLRVSAVQDAAVRKVLLRRLARMGWFPRLERDGSDFVLRWISLQVDDPRLRSVEARLTETHRLSSLVSSTGNGIRTIRYGKRDQVPVDPPAWPDLPVKTAQTLGAGDMFRVFGALVALFDPKQPAAAQTAGLENGEELPALETDGKLR